MKMVWQVMRQALEARLQESEDAWRRECRQRELLVKQASYEAKRAERQERDVPGTPSSWAIVRRREFWVG